MTKPASSRKPAAPQDRLSPPALGAADAALIAILLALALFLMARSGFRRGTELMPWPDGLEYAAVAVNLDHGLGPVLHFGGYSYPSRYTEGYPLILAAAYPILGGQPERLCLATVVMGLVAIAALYLLTFRMFGRPSACFAGLLLAVSPLFVTYSTLVLSDVPTLTVTILAALALFYATEGEDAVSPAARIVSAALCGLLAGFTVIIRPTNATIAVGIGAAVIAVAPLRRTVRDNIASAAALAAGFAIFPAWQAWENLRCLGGPLRSGYVFWVPEVYGSFTKTFSLRFLFGATMPRNPHGNVISYLLTLFGLDGLLGDPGDPRYMLYPAAAAIFAAIGIAAALKQAGGRAALRVIWFGLAFLAALLGLYLLYFFTEIAFVLPATFIVFAASGYGLAVANRTMRAAMDRSRKSGRDLAKISAILILDAMLAVAMLAETLTRAAAAPAPSAMVADLLSIRSRLESKSVVVSNISLQFLELYLAKPHTEMVGLNSFDPAARFTDYHLNRLYAKRAAGWNGPVPPVLFPGQRIDPDEAKSLAAKVSGGDPVYLLMAAPERPDYTDLLKDEMAQLSGYFSLEPVAQSELVGFFRLKPR